MGSNPVTPTVFYRIFGSFAWVRVLFKYCLYSVVKVHSLHQLQRLAPLVTVGFLLSIGIPVQLPAGG